MNLLISMVWLFLYRNTFPLLQRPSISHIPKLNLWAVLFTYSDTEHNWDLLFDSLSDDAVIGSNFNSHHNVWCDSIIDRAGAQLANSVLNSRFSLLNMGHHTFIGSFERWSMAIDLTICSSTIVHNFHWGINTNPLGTDNFLILIHLLPMPLASSNYRKTNWVAYTLSLTHLLHEELISFTSLQCQYDHLERVFQESITMTTPTRATASVFRCSKCPLWEKFCTLHNSLRQTALRNYRHACTKDNFLHYLRVHAKFWQVVRSVKRDHYRCFCALITIDTPSRQVWNKVCSLKCNIFPTVASDFPVSTLPSFHQMLAPDYVSLPTEFVPL
ncbi:hypothetical protein PR048_003087 [Dryococelus australis]|uniref:Endonuclease/exonuclease/phosphatase domain-containing protein n=1 Tax=Dryococelus australis TaxID=614101 RepID=A0ABQ9IM48_9NEOP|nr:hypothetical protein PR048_003087 [Dryococelus australis]